MKPILLVAALLGSVYFFRDTLTGGGAAADTGPSITYYGDGQKRSSVEIVDGLKQGRAEQWHANGQKECEGEYSVAFQYLRPGVVFYCPHCQASFVPTRTTYLEIAGALERFHARWEADFDAFQSKRRRELDEFEVRQREELGNFEQRLRAFTRAGQAATGTRRRWFV